MGAQGRNLFFVNVNNADAMIRQEGIIFNYLEENLKVYQ